MQPPRTHYIGLWILMVSAFSIAATQSAYAQFTTLSFQGRLTDSGGTPIADGNHDFQFRIYTTPGGSLVLWAEAQNLAVSNGVVSATLGSVTPINLPFDEQYYLSVILPPDTLYPRIPLTPAPYSHAAKKLAVPATLDAVGGGTTLTVNGSASGAAALFNGLVIFNSDSVRVLGDFRVGDNLRVDGSASLLGGLSSVDLHVPSGGNVGIGIASPSTRLHVVDDPNGSASFSNHVAGIDNVSTGTSADVLALRVGRSTAPESTNAYITFKYNGNTSAGFIRGNGAGGVELTSEGADYAEYLPHLYASETLEPGDVIGVMDGKISKRTEGAQQIMVVSTAPIVVGNHTSRSDSLESRVAFMGQAPVKVRGPVQTGDFLLPSGLDDGAAVAVRPAAIQPEQLKSVFGTAWESTESTGIARVVAAIGIDQRTTVARVIETLHERDRAREATLQSVVDRLEALEARLNL